MGGIKGHWNHQVMAVDGALCEVVREGDKLVVAIKVLEATC